MLASVTVTHVVTGTPYTFGHDLIECDPSLSCDNKASEILITVNDASGAYDDSSIGGPLFFPGDTIVVSIYKEGQTPIQIFNGTVDDAKIQHPSAYVKYLVLHGIDLSQKLMTRLVNTAYITFNTLTSPGFTIDSIVRDLITNPSVLLSYQNGTNTTGLGLTTNNVQTLSPEIYTQNQTFSRQSVNDCIRQLANIANANFYVDASGDVHFFVISSIFSSVTLDNTVIMSLEIEDDGTSIENDIFVVGGSEDAIDAAPSRTLTVGTSNSGQAVLTVQSTSQYFVGEQVMINPTGPTQELKTISSINPGVSLTMSANLTYTHNGGETVIADNGSESSYQNYYAQEFTAGQYELDQVVFLMHKVQSSGLVPVNNISGEVRQDNNGSPAGGATIVTFSIQGSAVPNTNETLVNVNAGGTLVPGQNYWLILYAGGQDANDTYYWHTDGSTTGSHAHSTDGINWTIVTSSYNFVFETLVAQQVLNMSSDATSMSKYGSRETVVTDTTIPTFQAAAQEAQAYLNVLAKKKRYLTIQAFPTDTLIEPGQQVKVIDGNLNAYFMCLDISYKIADVSCYEVDYRMFEYVA